MTLAQDSGSASLSWHLANNAGRFVVFDQPNIDTAGTERLTIANGKVGIGIQAPRRSLDVVGEIVATNGMTLAQDAGSATTIWHLDNNAGRFRIYEAANINGGGTERLTMVNGNVGIGTAAPNAKLDVSGSGASQCCAPVQTTISLAENSQGTGRQAWLQFHNQGEAEAYIRLAGGGPAGSGRDGGRRFEIGDNQGVTTDLKISGNVTMLAASNPLNFTRAWSGTPDAASNVSEISNDTGTYKTLMIIGNRSAGSIRRVSVWDRLEVNGDLIVTGNAFKPGGGFWTSTSDEELKKDIAPIEGALEKVLQLRGISFAWREPETQNATSERYMGMVAQEVEKVFPQWVKEVPSGHKGLNIVGFEALMVEALRQLNAKCEKLEAEMAQLREAVGKPKGATPARKKR